jgi:hypothetical protein
VNRRLLACFLAVAVAGCQAAPSTPPVDMTDARVALGLAKTCEDLAISPVRCTLLTLRATTRLDEARPGHAKITAYEFHEPATPPAGGSAIASSEVVAAIVVFTLRDGSRVGIPIVCPRAAGGDQACNPEVR